MIFVYFSLINSLYDFHLIIFDHNTRKHLESSLDLSLALLRDIYNEIDQLFHTFNEDLEIYKQQQSILPTLIHLMIFEYVIQLIYLISLFFFQYFIIDC